MTMVRRRTVLNAGLVASLGAMTGVAACKPPPPAKPSPFAGFHMPLESEPHERTFMQWPVRADVYGTRLLERVQKDIALIANSIAHFEPVVMLVGRDHAAVARSQLGGGVAIWDIPTDDLWCRDSGPTFIRKADSTLAVAHLRFNGWGNKQPHGQDAKIAERVAARLGVPLLRTGLVGEQGGLEHDGDGTFLAHASCWANPNRNRLSQEKIGARILETLGGDKMIWAPGIKGADITDYHIDALARFVSPGRVLIQMPDGIDPDDPWSRSAHETLAILKAATDAKGRKLEIIQLPEPVDIRSTKSDFVASYVNYYVCNGAVISAQFGDAKADARAKALLSDLYPGRQIVTLNIDAIGESGGGIHCATQQQPKGKIA